MPKPQKPRLGGCTGVGWPCGPAVLSPWLPRGCPEPSNAPMLARCLPRPQIAGRGDEPGDYGKLITSSKFCLVAPGDGAPAGRRSTLALLLAVGQEGGGVAGETGHQQLPVQPGGCSALCPQLWTMQPSCCWVLQRMRMGCMECPCRVVTPV
jgi:hypothetical protein